MPRGCYAHQMKGLEKLICLGTKILKIGPKLKELWPEQYNSPDLLSKVTSDQELVRPEGCLHRPIQEDSIVLAITPTILVRFSKFLCLNILAFQDLSFDVHNTHVARAHVPKNVA